MEFSIRKAELDDMRQIAYIHVDCWKEAYNGIIDRELLARLSYGKSQKNMKYAFERGTQMFFVAEINNEIIGFAVGGISRDEDLIYEGEIYAMYIRNKFHNLGIGKALVLTFAKEFKKQNWLNFIIWCLNKNTACGFYQKIGGIPDEEKKIKIGSKNFKEIGFIYNTEATIQLLSE